MNKMAAVVEAPTEVEKVPLTNAGIPDWGLDAVGGEVKFRFKLDRDDESRGQCVVVKQYRIGDRDTKDVKASLRQLMAGPGASYLWPMLDVETSVDGCLSVTSPFAFAGSLKTHMRLDRAAFGEANINRFLDLAEGLLLGLQHLHGQGHAHGYLTPGTVLFSDARRVKVAGFEMAVVQPLLADAPQITGSTARHMAPELLSAEPNAKSDVYSVGMVLLHATSREEPFGEFDDFMDVCGDAGKYLLKLHFKQYGWMPGPIRTAINHALRSPDRRPSIEAFLDAVRQSRALLGQQDDAAFDLAALGDALPISPTWEGQERQGVITCSDCKYSSNSTEFPTCTLRCGYDQCSWHLKSPAEPRLRLTAAPQDLVYIFYDLEVAYYAATGACRSRALWEIGAVAEDGRCFTKRDLKDAGQEAEKDAVRAFLQWVCDVSRSTLAERGREAVSPAQVVLVAHNGSNHDHHLLLAAVERHGLVIPDFTLGDSMVAIRRNLPSGLENAQLPETLVPHYSGDMVRGRPTKKLMHHGDVDSVFLAAVVMRWDVRGWREALGKYCTSVQRYWDSLGDQFERWFSHKKEQFSHEFEVGSLSVSDTF